jgi:hypothetical protein
MCRPRVGEANQLFSVYIALWRLTALAMIYNVVRRQRNLGLECHLIYIFHFSDFTVFFIECFCQHVLDEILLILVDVFSRHHDLILFFCISHLLFSLFSFRLASVSEGHLLWREALGFVLYHFVCWKLHVIVFFTLFIVSRILC